MSLKNTYATNLTSKIKKFQYKMACYHMNVISVKTDSLIRKDGEISDFTNRIIFANSPDFKGYEFYMKENERLKKKDEPYQYKFIPCGKCIGCRTQERKNWALRLELESEKYKHNYFITLTYDDEHLKFKDHTIVKSEWDKELPIGYTKIYTRQNSWNGTLVKEELSQFIKSFRNYCKRDFNHDGIKFYACGEYGSKTERPHYHIIMMNCPEIKLEPIGNYNRKTKDAYYTNERIQHIWGKGFVQIGTVTWDSISYTAGYCMKKLFGEVKDEYHASRGQTPPFALMSRNPGIGKEFFNKEYQNIYDIDEIINSKGKSVKPPRYFDRLMDEQDHEYMKLVKFKRQFISQNETKKKLKMTSKTLAEQMLIDENNAIQRQKIYNRERIK